MSSLSHKGVAAGIIAIIVPSALVLVPQRIPPIFSVGMHPCRRADRRLEIDLKER